MYISLRCIRVNFTQLIYKKNTHPAAQISDANITNNLAESNKNPTSRNSLK
jgi:hypothetical protein